MAETTGAAGASRETTTPPATTLGLRGSILRYLVAWLFAAAVLYLAAPRIGGWGEGPVLVALCLLAGGAAVVVAFVLGLVLRNRSTGSDWHRGGVWAGCALAAALAAQIWHRELATWVVGMPLERTTMGEDYAAVIAAGAWFASVFLIANFPRRACAGLRFAETFSPAERRWLPRAGCVAALLAGVAWFGPAPLSGYWHTPYSDCLCDSKNLLVFEDGRVFQWASAHGVAKEPYGTYQRHFRWVTWDTGKEKIEIRPGWFLMRIRLPDDYPVFGGKTRFGCREWRSDYIREVLATTPAVAGDADETQAGAEQIK